MELLGRDSLILLVIITLISIVQAAPVRKGVNDIIIRLNGSIHVDTDIERCETVTEVAVTATGITPWTVNQDIINEKTCPEPLVSLCRNGPNETYSSPFFEGDIILDPNTRQLIENANEKQLREKAEAKIRRGKKVSGEQTVEIGNQNTTIITIYATLNGVNGTRVVHSSGSTTKHSVERHNSSEHHAIGGHVVSVQRQHVVVTSSHVSSHSRNKRALVKGQEQRWPNGVVPYTIDDNFPADYKSVIRMAMRHWGKNTCVKFVPKLNKHDDYVRFAFYPGCWSYIGRQGGEQILSVGYSCNTMRTIVHEMGHAIGLWHEQSRRDRDKYIKVAKGNLAPGTENNFNKVEIENITSLGYAYDFDSVMHYDAYAFTTNGRPTLKVKKDYRQIPTTELGMKDRISDIDIAQLNAMYECNQRREDQTECFESAEGDGREYRGEINFTKDFITCQKWSTQWPNKHDQYSIKPRKNERIGLGEHNYCRNPGGKRKKPWCFTTHKKIRWQFCPVKLC